MRYFLLWMVIGMTACGDDSTVTDAGLSDAEVPDVPVDAPPDATADVGIDAPLDSPIEDTWSTFASEWFATYCTECHAGGRRDYTTIDEVLRDSARIRCGVSPDRPLEGCGASPGASQFPVGGGPRPDDDSRRRLVQWIDDGLTE